jgi:hypothetical protein
MVRVPPYRARMRSARVLLAAGMVAASALGAPVFAQTAPRTFVATTGSDANAAALCSRTAPCRNFSAALGVTQDGGEAVALDSGGFGSVRITRPVTLTAPEGVHAILTGAVRDGAAVQVESTGSVTLRGLSMVPGAGSFGVIALGADALALERCAFDGFGDFAVALGGQVGRVSLRDTVIRGSRVGVHVDGADVRLVVQGTRLEANEVGVNLVRARAASIVRSSISSRPSPSTGTSTAVRVSEGARVSVSDSTIALSTIGLDVTRGSALLSRCRIHGNGQGARVSHQGTLVAHEAVFTGNATGVVSLRDGVAVLDRSTVVRNGVGIDSAGNLEVPGVVATRGNNLLRGNDVELAGLMEPLGGL